MIDGRLGPIFGVYSISGCFSYRFALSACVRILLVVMNACWDFFCHDPPRGTTRVSAPNVHSRKKQVLVLPRDYAEAQGVVSVKHGLASIPLAPAYVRINIRNTELRHLSSPLSMRKRLLEKKKLMTVSAGKRTQRKAQSMKACGRTMLRHRSSPAEIDSKKERTLLPCARRPRRG